MDGSWAELAEKEHYDDEELDFPGNDEPKRRKFLDLRRLDSGHSGRSDENDASPRCASTPRGRFISDDEWDDAEEAQSPAAAEPSGGALCSGGVTPATPSQRLPRWPFPGYIPPIRYRLPSWDFSHLAPVDPDLSDEAREARELAFAALDARREWQRQLGASLLRDLKARRGGTEGKPLAAATSCTLEMITEALANGVYLESTPVPSDA